MLEALLNRLRPASERAKLQNEAGINELPAKALCKATWTNEQGESIIVNLLGTDKGQQIALLAYKKEDKKGSVWIAKRDQSGAPGTWMWTQKQMEIGQRRNKRIRDKIAEIPIEVKPLHSDRRTEILAIGQMLGYTDEKVIERLRVEGFDTKLPQDYRTTWNPYEGNKTTEPLLDVVKPQELP